MKLGGIKNPITGGSISLTPGSILGIVGGMIVFILAFGFAQFGAGWIKSKLPAGAAAAANGNGTVNGITFV